MSEAVKKTRIVMVGAGNIANIHLDAYKKNPRVEIVAVCDVDPVRLKMTCDRFGIEKSYTDLSEMLADKSLLADAADVCVWNCSHAACSIAALNAGLHVICEKPMAMNTQEAEKMKAVAEKNRKLLMIAFVCRFNDEQQIALDFIKQGYVGQVYYARASYMRRHGSPGGWFSDKARSGGGPVIDLGVHVIDQTRVLMGSPRPVSVFAVTSDLIGDGRELKTNVGYRPYGAKDDDKFDVEDFGAAMIRYDNGAVVLLETSYSLNGEPSGKKEMFGSTGGIRLESGKVTLYTQVNGFMSNITPDIQNYKNTGDGFYKELDHFVDCLQNGTPCAATADDGIIVMKILDAIYESGRTGHEVLIK